MKEMQETKGCANSAEVCRANGWGPGTRLVGNEGYGPTVMIITAIGESVILGRGLSHDGKTRDDSEHCWTLSCRDWKEIKDAN
jgi:hypothetical protein